MPLTSFPGGIWLPNREHSATGDLAYTSYLCDANGEKFAMIIQAPKTGTISKIGWRTGTVTTGNTVDVRVETVSATDGNPTGTLWSTTTNIGVSVVNADDDKWFLSTLTSGAAVVQGNLIAIVLSVPASTNLNFVAVTRPYVLNFPYVSHFAGGAWTKDSKAPCLALEYNDGNYYQIPGCLPYSSLVSATFDTTTDPSEYALKFQLPFNADLAGFWYGFSKEQNVTVRLYDSANTIRATRTLVSADYGTKTVGLYDHAFFSSVVRVKKNTVYRLGVAASTTTPSLTAMKGTCNSTGIMAALDCGANFHLSARKGQNFSWVDTATARPYLGLILSKIDTLLGTI